MTITYTHFQSNQSINGLISKMVHDDGTIMESPSLLNDDSTVNESRSEKHLLSQYEFLKLVETQGSYFESIDANNVIDRTYMNGVQIRTDYSVGNVEGQVLVKRLKDTWPYEVESYDNNGMNLVAEYIATRPPYDNNPCISFYSWDPASSELLESFGANYNEYKDWYGLKFDTVTEEVVLKAVIPPSEMLIADADAHNAIMDLLPANNFTFFARLHDKEGIVNENIDVYFQALTNTVKEWCDDNNLNFPFDINNSNIIDKLFIWGFVYNKTSGEITHVKGYTRETAN